VRGSALKRSMSSMILSGGVGFRVSNMGPSFRRR
jgi:hypothetical protein